MNDMPNACKRNTSKRQKSNTITGLKVACTGVLLAAVISEAQPAKDANKFLGNITSRGQVRSDFGKYWNQITGENEHKWATVERSRDQMSWGGGDRVASYAETAGIPWKFHTLVWGSQFPTWITSLSQAEQLAEIEEWFDAAKAKYPNLPMIDVVNEAHPNHAPAPFKNALGGDGATGYDWIMKSFQMARARWPKAILIYNDYNNMEYKNEVDWTVKMINTLVKAGAPIDAIGCQAHDTYKINTNTIKSNLDKLAATGLPIFVTEYDIGYSDDAQQLRSIQDQFPVMWNHPSIVGVTYWGYIVGQTWRTGTGLMTDGGAERPALTWLVDYVKKNPSPANNFPDFLATGVTSIPDRAFANSGGFFDQERELKIFDMQGKEIGSFLGDKNSLIRSSLLPSKGNYILHDGKSSQIIRINR